MTQLTCCGLTQSMHIPCKSCKSRELVPVGASTQRIHGYLSSHFPNTNHFLALIRAQAKNQAKLLQFLHAIKTRLLTQGVTVMGPAPAPLARKAHQHRMQLLIKSSSRKKLHAVLTPVREWLTMNKMTNGVRWNVDIDPMDLT